MKYIFYILISCFSILSFSEYAFASIFSMSKNPKPESNAAGNTIQNEEIPVFDSVDKLIQKRKNEAYKLIKEAKELIKKGEKRNNQSLITKGKIKKDIGEKQLQVLKEQASNKKAQDKNDGW